MMKLNALYRLFEFSVNSYLHWKFNIRIILKLDILNFRFEELSLEIRGNEAVDTGRELFDCTSDSCSQKPFSEINDN